jgi:hypothetical protein
MGECLCEVIFEGEDREKRLRPRSAKGKGKQADKEAHGGARSGESSGGKNDHLSAGRRYENNGPRPAGVGYTGPGVRDGTRYDQRHAGGGLDPAPGGGARRAGSGFGEGVQYGYVDQGKGSAGMNAGGNFGDRGSYGQGYARQNAGLEHGNYGGEGSYESDISGLAGLQMHAGPEAGPSHWSRHSWDPEAKQAAYQYVGYVVNDPQQQRPAAPEYGYGMPAAGGYYPSHLVWEGQTMLGQPGAGMKWYPQPDPSQSGTTSNEQPQPALKGNDKSGRKTKTWSKAHSEPNNKPYQAYAESVTEYSEPQAELAVVSSDMAKPGH